jgi:hypothetical protein
MVTHLFPKFLDSQNEYSQSAEYWIQLWEKIDKFQRAGRGWRQPWLWTGMDKGGDFLDGNPIFSAYSPIRHEGIRIIQYIPSSNKLEFDCWLDNFGGDETDPASIRELVIACALSEESSNKAYELMQEWILRGDISRRNEPPTIDYEFNLITPLASSST